MKNIIVHKPLPDLISEYDPRITELSTEQLFVIAVKCGLLRCNGYRDARVYLTDSDGNKKPTGPVQVAGCRERGIDIEKLLGELQIIAMFGKPPTF
jgi:hypothetical protein